MEWKEPPPRTRQGSPGIWNGIVSELRANPGQWALVRTYAHPSSASSTATQLKIRFPRLEVTSRKRDDGQADMYARWVGVTDGTPHR